MAVLTRIEPGASISVHWHSKADETEFVIEGDFVEDRESYGPGSYFIGKARTPHGLTRLSWGASSSPTSAPNSTSRPAPCLQKRERRVMLGGDVVSCGLA